MKFIDVLAFVGLLAFFFLAYLLVPYFGPLIILLTPFPFLYYSSKLGVSQGLKLAAVAIIVIGFAANLTGHPWILVSCLEFSLLGFALAELFRRKLSLGQTICLATSFMVIVGSIFLYFIALSKNMGPLEMMLNYLDGHMDVVFKAYREGSGIPQDRAAEFEGSARAFVHQVYPSLMIIGIAFVVWLNIIVAKPLFRRGNLQYPDFGPIDNWQAPEGLVWIFIVAGFALFLSSRGIQFVAKNTLIIAVAIYFFHGLSIILFFLNKYRVPSWIRFVVYFIIIIRQLFWAILILAGLFDQWVDFRKIHRRKAS